MFFRKYEEWFWVKKILIEEYEEAKEKSFIK